MYKKIGVYFIFQPDEVESTLKWIAQIHVQCSSRIKLFGISNGYLDETWKKAFKDFEHLVILFSHRNLGVASGRNAVLKNALNWGAELLVSLDNDILVPKDYFQKMAVAYRELKSKNPNLGIIVPSLFDINSLCEILPLV